MRSAMWGLLFFCSAAFAQTATDNVAADALKKRLEEMKLVNPPQLGRPGQVIAAPPVVALPAQPKVCSVPLRNALPDSERNVTIRRVLPMDKGPAVIPAPPAPQGTDTLASPKAGPAEVEKMQVIKPIFAGQAKDFAALPAPPCEQ